MLQINRVVSDDSKFTDLHVELKGYRGLVFDLKSYPKLALNTEEKIGDHILSATNQFLATLDLNTARHLVEMYSNLEAIIEDLENHNWRSIQNDMVETIEVRLNAAEIVDKLINFCDDLEYPKMIVEQHHHRDRRTYYKNDIICLTALSIFMKILLPLTAGVMKRLNEINEAPTDNWNVFLLPIIDRVLEATPLSHIYSILVDMAGLIIGGRRAHLDVRVKSSSDLSSVILKDSGVSDRDFEYSVMGYLLIKRLTTFMPTRFRDDQTIPNIAVYIDDSLKRYTETQLRALSNRLS
jgi:hypothetical protein